MANRSECIYSQTQIAQKIIIYYSFINDKFLYQYHRKLSPCKKHQYKHKSDVYYFTPLPSNNELEILTPLHIAQTFDNG